MNPFETSFQYDVILSLNASIRLRERFPVIKAAYHGQRMLAATFDHRFYRLHEKNFMKGFIETHNLDHLLFTLRPSANRIMAARSEREIHAFKDMSQVLFVLHLMAKYHIDRAVLDATTLVMGPNGATKVADVEHQVRTFLDDLRMTHAAVPNVRKQFCSLFDVEDVLPQIRDRELVPVRAFNSDDISSAGYEFDDHQISPLEKNLFWVGFDPAYKEVPADKPYPTTKWTDLADRSEFGKGCFEGKIKYCTRCCLPETMEGMTFDETGMCVPCRSSEVKMHINWETRRQNLEAMLNAHRSDISYDCMLPMSGGKDSTYQAYMLTKVLNVTPLAVTHGQNWYSLIGRYNLENCLQQFDLDHLIFNMNRQVINRVARTSLGAIGDACWHCHIGAGTFAVQVAIAWNIDLMIWGESIAESDGRSSYDTQTEASLLYNLEVSARVKAEDMSDDITSAKDMSPWIYPSPEVLGRTKVRYVHLGDYFFWDEERQVEFIKRNFEWMDSRVENTYKGYKSVECVMAGVHDYTNFIKRGVGRGTIHAAEDIRRGLLTREEGCELAKKFDAERPHALDFYLSLTGFSEDELETTLKEARSKSEYAMKMSKVGD